MINEKIKLTRIDNRLVHGQVGVTWTSSLAVSTIVVVDDMVIQDKLQQRLMETVAKTGNADIRFLSIKDFIYIAQNNLISKKIFLVVKTPQVVAQIVENGIFIDSCNIGNMHYSKGKKPITKKIYVDEEDEKAFKFLLENNVTLFAQDIPDSLRENITINSFSFR